MCLIAFSITSQYSNNLIAKKQMFIPLLCEHPSHVKCIKNVECVCMLSHHPQPVTSFCHEFLLQCLTVVSYWLWTFSGELQIQVWCQERACTICAHDSFCARYQERRDQQLQFWEVKTDFMINSWMVFLFHINLAYLFIIFIFVISARYLFLKYFYLYISFVNLHIFFKVFKNVILQF